MSFSRNNNATAADINRDRLFATGTFKNVWQGRYIAGARTGEACVAKEFKSGAGSAAFEDHYFQEELNIIERAQSIIDSWHAARGGQHHHRIVMSRPQIWQYRRNGRKALVEPFILNFQKFNSNTGWVAHGSGGARPDSWCEAMQALSHFSYHVTGGQFLLCDLQGGMHGDVFCGPGDLGPNGIHAFFRRHKCTRFCDPRWIKPRSSVKSAFSKRRGTTMVSRVPAHQTRLSRTRRIR
ncbi:hypothetical protein DHEL01_v207898 [Diaporthe helianthi]|uniref:Alpha-type protein kinase domain-containing protein n=1 Tax=Diaporthe helianthi TaxID=158607 RepID=A0A2P5HTW9_DIAHE|nr:hypothetical protein DHEL01_v207898 [Diaporthe helianthi]